MEPDVVEFASCDEKGRLGVLSALNEEESH